MACDRCLAAFSTPGSAGPQLSPRLCKSGVRRTCLRHGALRHGLPESRCQTAMDRGLRPCSHREIDGDCLDATAVLIISALCIKIDKVLSGVGIATGVLEPPAECHAEERLIIFEACENPRYNCPSIRISVPPDANVKARQVHADGKIGSDRNVVWNRFILVICHRARDREWTIRRRSV